MSPTSATDSRPSLRLLVHIILYLKVTNIAGVVLCEKLFYLAKYLANLYLPRTAGGGGGVGVKLELSQKKDKWSNSMEMVGPLPSNLCACLIS